MSEHDEWKSAITFTADCYAHHWLANRLGGGTCMVCGAEVDWEEL